MGAQRTGGEDGGGASFVKVSMDGAPYLRKVDLKLYSSYKDLSHALAKMFSSFTIGNFFFTFFTVGNFLRHTIRLIVYFTQKVKIKFGWKFFSRNS